MVAMTHIRRVEYLALQSNTVGEKVDKANIVQFQKF